MINIMKILIIILFVMMILVQSCIANTNDSATSIPNDQNFLNAPFNSCRSLPPENLQLTARELCLVDKLKARCSVADDCLVSCIVSGKGREIGGGCWHICFQERNDLSSWNEPDGFRDCQSNTK